MKKILILLICFLSELGCEINWSAPVTLSSMDVNSSDPQIVMDPNGNVTAAWVENGFIVASFQPVGHSWGSAKTLSASGASSIKLGVDSSGNVIAIWLDSNDVVNASTLPFNGSWTDAVAISDPGAATPALAVDPDGNAVAIWARAGTIEASMRVFFVGTWRPFETLSAVNSDHPQVAMNANGTIMAVWHTTVDSLDQIISASATLGGNWNSPKTIAEANSVMHKYPKVALDSSGNATAVWFRYVPRGSNFTNVYVVYSSLPAGETTWSIPLPLSNEGLGDPANFTASINYDSKGNLFVIWTISYNGSTFNIESIVRQVGQKFTSLKSFVIDNIYAFKVDAAVNSFSDAVIAFMVFKGKNILIKATETQIVGAVVNSYSPSIILSKGSDNGFPCVASVVTSDNAIHAAVVWISSDGINQTIIAANGSRRLIAPPLNLAVQQSSSDHGIFTEYFNTVTWDASEAPNLLAYGIFRDGMFLQQVGSNMTQFIDHNVMQNVSVTYGVSALDNRNSQSSIATITFAPK